MVIDINSPGSLVTPHHRKWIRRLAAVAMVLVASTLHAQGITLVRAKAYLDVDRGTIVSPAVIVVSGERITAVNPEHPPMDATVIDLPEMILLPGMIDVHTHLSYEIKPGWEAEAVSWTLGEYALRSGKNARTTLMAGFTTVREVGAPGFVDVATMKAIERGDAIGPDIIPSGHAITTTGGHCDYSGFAPGVVEGDYRSGIADGVDEVRKAIRYQIKYGAKSIKICATASVFYVEGPVGALQYSQEELNAAADEAHRHGLQIAAHAHGKDGIVAAARAGIDFIEHNSMMDAEAAAIIKGSGAWISPNMHLIENADIETLPLAMRPRARAALAHAVASFRLGIAQGLKTAFGTDAGVFAHGENARELAARVRQGMSSLEAVRSATLYSARALGLEDRGQVKTGLLADLIAVKGDPLKDISLLQNTRFVMKRGVVYKQTD
jgi:imidazolonepropionase-like amidohydrolase